MIQLNVGTWMLCEKYVIFLYMLHMIDMWMTLFIWLSMWHVNDWEHVWYVLSWVSYATTMWIIWSFQMPVIGRVIYRNVHIELHSVYSCHTYMCYETMHSFLKKTFISYMQMGLQWFYDILVVNQSWKKGMIYIFKDEFKYVIEKKG